jgi:hypothetical protein
MINLPIPVQADNSSILVLAQLCTNLTKLQLHSTSQAFPKQCILHIAAHLPSLRVLELLGCAGLHDSCLFALAHGCPELSRLSLDGLDSVPEAAMCVSLLLLLQRLESVSLKGAEQFSMSGLRALLTSNKDLQHVHLPSAPPAWHTGFKQMSQEELDTWGIGRISPAWHGADLGMLRVHSCALLLYLLQF